MSTSNEQEKSIPKRKSTSTYLKEAPAAIKQKRKAHQHIWKKHQQQSSKKNISGNQKQEAMKLAFETHHQQTIRYGDMIWYPYKLQVWYTVIQFVWNIILIHKETENHYTYIYLYFINIQITVYNMSSQSSLVQPYFQILYIMKRYLSFSYLIQQSWWNLMWIGYYLVHI